MRILVTGGAGFVGSHLCARLTQDGHEVICVDSLFSGTKENIASLLEHKRFSFVEHDIRKPLQLANMRIDRMYNLACPASPDQYQFDPVLTLETSVLGVHNMLKLAQNTGARLLQASTSEVYGDPLEHPQKETYWGNVDPLGKRACYDEGKRAAETLCKDYRVEYGVDARIIRIFNTYGPNMMFNDGRVLSNFVLQALLGEPITVHGDGSQTRSFMYVDDLVEGIVRVMETSSYDGLPINLGNPDERTIQNVAELVVQHTKSKSEIDHIPLENIPEREGDPKQRCADITRAKTMLDWEPKIGFEEGLVRTIVDFEKRLKHRDRVLVCMPEFDERFVRMVAHMQQWEFDVITHTKPKVDIPDTVHVHTVGTRGFSWRAARLAKKMHKKHPYKAMWTILSGKEKRKGMIATLLFSWFTGRRIAVLLSVYEDEVTEVMLARGAAKGWKYKLLFRHEYRWQVVGAMSPQQQAWLENERGVQTVSTDDVSLLAVRSKQLLQQVHILSTRI